MFSQACVCSGRGVSLVPGPFCGEGISGTRSLLGIGMPRGRYSPPDMGPQELLTPYPTPQTWDLG